MTVFVFAGPTVSADLVQAHNNVVCLPPVAQGDVYRAAQSRPRAIGIIDGYFEGSPAVWHKEILWAMAQGIHVFGSASMGALRASELHEFGMIGIGRIFEAFCSGALEDDDEVAVLHGPSEANYVTLSEALVNIRATLMRAKADEVISPELCQTLLDLAKELFYQQRRWDILLEHPSLPAPAAPQCAALRDWLPRGRVDLKREDAVAMLDAMADRLSRDGEPMQVNFRFEWTDMWDSVTTEPAVDCVQAASVGRQQVLDELRLEGERYCQAADRALLRRLALQAHERQRMTIDKANLDRTVKRLRSQLGLLSRRDIDRWLVENGSDLEGLDQLLRDEARLQAIRDTAGPLLDSHLIDELRLTGRYTELANRVADKQRALGQMGLKNPEPGDVGPPPPQLLSWYFESMLRRAIPDDIQGFWRGVGYQSKEDFYRAVLCEYLYLNCSDQLGGTDHEGAKD